MEFLQGLSTFGSNVDNTEKLKWDFFENFLAWKFQEPSDTVFHMSFRFIVMLWKLQVRFPNLWHWRRWLHLAGGTLHGDETQTPRWNDFNFVTFRCCRWWWATTWRRSSCTVWSTGELSLHICRLRRKLPSSGRSRTPTRTWTGRLVSRSSRSSSASWAGRSPRRWWYKCDHDQAIEGVLHVAGVDLKFPYQEESHLSRIILCNVRWPFLIPT